MTVTVTGFHGTCDIIKRFDLEYSGTNTGNNVGGFFFSSDYCVGMDYSIEAYKRKYEYEYEENYTDEYEEVLQEHAENQCHVYKCEIQFENPLILDLDKDEIRHHEYRHDVPKFIDMQALIFMMNNSVFYGYDGTYTKEELWNIVTDYYLDYFEEYDEELDEYTDKPAYDGLIIKNACDGIEDYSMYTQADVYVALYDYQIKIVDCIYENKELELVA